MDRLQIKSRTSFGLFLITIFLLCTKSYAQFAVSLNYKNRPRNLVIQKLVNNLYYLSQDLSYMKAQATTLNKLVRIHFKTDATYSCYSDIPCSRWWRICFSCCCGKSVLTYRILFTSNSLLQVSSNQLTDLCCACQLVNSYFSANSVSSAFMSLPKWYVWFQGKNNEM